MIPKNTSDPRPRSDYQKPVENSLPNQIINAPAVRPENINKNSNNVYQIEENDFSNSIDMNYEINMDIHTNPGMHFSNINFENIDRKKQSISHNSPSQGI